MVYATKPLKTVAKVQLLNKPYIHYIDVKIMNNVSRKSLDYLISEENRQQYGIKNLRTITVHMRGGYKY